MGQVFGAYTLVEPLGAGGMGSVWLARRNDGHFEGMAAVKILSAALLGAAGASRFRREGTILARLKHPNIAQLIDAGVSEAGQPYLVLEYVEGETIDRWCDDRSLDIESRIRLFLDVLAAVKHVHSNLVVHRDLKPSNVMVSKEGRVKLLDFGIAKLLAGDDSGDAAPTQDLLSHADPYVAGHGEPTVRSLLDAGAVRARQDLTTQPEMLTLLGRIYERRGAYEQACRCSIRPSPSGAGPSDRAESWPRA